jgi:hypothetical protein
LHVFGSKGVRRVFVDMRIWQGAREKEDRGGDASSYSKILAVFQAIEGAILETIFQTYFNLVYCICFGDIGTSTVGYALTLQSNVQRCHGVPIRAKSRGQASADRSSCVLTRIDAQRAQSNSKCW